MAEHVRRNPVEDFGFACIFEDEIAHSLGGELAAELRDEDAARIEAIQLAQLQIAAKDADDIVVAEVKRALPPPHSPHGK